LKTRGGVNEIFAGLGLNFVAQGLTLWLIFGPWKRPGVASMSGTELFSENLWLYQSPGLRIAPTALLLALVAIAATAVILRFARFGLCLRAIGRNAFAAGLFGLHPARYMLLAMLVAGGMAGIAGGLQVVAVYHRLLPAISSNYGYLALLVVLLANDRIAAAVVASLVFAGLNVGAIQLPMALQLDSSLSGVIQGALVLATVALSARSQKPAAQS
jgi:simple sugar transport system permease protein